MKFLKGIIYTLVIFVVLFLLVAFFLPKQSTMEFKTEINAPIGIVFNQVNSLQNWEHWSPFTENMIAIKSSYLGPESGIGNQYKWTSQKENGEIIIIASENNTRIETDLDFYENGKGKGYWTFKEADGKIQVSWEFTVIELDYPTARWVGLFFDKIMAPTFNKGLSNLKDYCESKEAWNGITEIDYPATPIIYINKNVKFIDISTFFTEAYGKLGQHMMKNKLQMTGAPFAIYYEFNRDTPNSTDACFPTTDLASGDKEISARTMPATKAIVFDFYGPYEESEKGHLLIQEYMKIFGYQMNGAPWEAYITDPSQESNQNKWLTKIYYPVKN